MSGVVFISASASEKAVKVAITLAAFETGTAGVKFDYKVVIRICRVVFASE